jgi:hypothetical protein
MLLATVELQYVEPTSLIHELEKKLRKKEMSNQDESHSPGRREVGCRKENPEICSCVNLFDMGRERRAAGLISELIHHRSTEVSCQERNVRQIGWIHLHGAKSGRGTYPLFLKRLRYSLNIETCP